MVAVGLFSLAQWIRFRLRWEFEEKMSIGVIKMRETCVFALDFELIREKGGKNVLADRFQAIWRIYFL